MAGLKAAAICQVAGGGINENTIHRRRHGARHAVHQERRARRERRCGGWAAGRSTPAFTSSCRAARPARTRRSPLAERLRIVEILVDEANGQGAGARRRRRLRHEGSHPSRRRDAQGGRVGAALGHALLQQADAGRAVSSTIRAIADSTPLPIVVYNVPGRTGVNVDVATLVRLAAIPNIVGVKEASGNVTQMCEVCRAVPSDFIVLSGDDALTLPLMAVGGRGIISVASNEIPARWSQMVEAAERNDFAAARAIHARILPLMQINFVESNPGPVKAAMAAMGLLEEVYRLPMVSPRPESKEKILAVLKRPQAVRRARRTHEPSSRRSTDLVAAGAARRSRRRARDVRAAARGAVGRPRARRRARSVRAGRLARQRLGQAGHPARLPVRRHRRRVDGSRQAGRSTTRTRCR